MNPIVKGLMATAIFASAPTFAQQAAYSDGTITGKMTIEFGSRIEKGKDDKYVSDLVFNFGATGITFKGPITRVYQGGSTPVALQYNVDVGAKQGDKAIQLGQIWGLVPIDSNGRYNFASNAAVASEDRVAVKTLKNGSITGQLPYDGQIQGRRFKSSWNLIVDQAKCKVSSAAKVIPVEITRTIGSQTVKMALTDPDPMKFLGVVMPAGPVPGANAAQVNGDFVYGYTKASEGIWALNGVNIGADILTGTVRYVDASGQTVKVGNQSLRISGYYEFNIRYNESATAGQTKADDLFNDTKSGDADLDAMFATDAKAAGVTGKIYYVDSDMQQVEKLKADCSKETVEVPARSEVTYDLKTAGMSRSQVVNFMKFWMMAVGPTNDE